MALQAYGLGFRLWLLVYHHNCLLLGVGDDHARHEPNDGHSRQEPISTSRRAFLSWVYGWVYLASLARNVLGGLFGLVGPGG